jgi:hypothetical protein
MNPLIIVIVITILGFAFGLLLVKLFTPTREEKANMLRPFEEYVASVGEAKATFAGEEIRDLGFVQPKLKVWSIDQMQTMLAVLEYCINHDTYFKYYSELYVSPEYRVDIKMDTYESYMHDDKLFGFCCSCLNSCDGVIFIGMKGNGWKKKFTVGGYSRRFDEVMKNIPFKFTDKRKQLIDLSEYFPTMKVYPLLGKEVLAIEIKQVPGHLKKIYFNGSSYSKDPE